MITHEQQLNSIEFPWKRPGEKIYLMLRAHWLIITGHIISTCVLILIPPTLFLLGQYFFKNIVPTDLRPIINLTVSAYYLFLLIYFYIGWLDYYLDVWIVTDERIINIVQDGMFQRTVSELNIYRVQDATAVSKGIIQTFFRYGDVLIQSAGTQNRFNFNRISDPYQVKKIIMEIHDLKIKKDQEAGVFNTHATQEIAEEANEMSEQNENS